MIKSMTGYGSSKKTIDGFEIGVELKSVNNRYLEVAVKLPRNFIFAEEAIKSAVSRHVSRGKVDVFITIKAAESDDVQVNVNESLIRGYYDAVNKIASITGLSNDITAMSLAKFPDVLTIETVELDKEQISSDIISVLEEALNDYDNMRINEGKKLKEDVENRLHSIESFVTEIETRAPNTVFAYEEKLKKRMLEILDSKDIDESRIIQEVAIFADHIAVDEETVRLRSHIGQLESMINGESPIGRKIDFLVQEFNREANTIGSKCQSSELARIVVDLKSEIEKIREQIQNIE